MSTLYGHIYKGGVYPEPGHFSNGRANIVLPVKSKGNEVIFKFETPYAADPVCFVNFEAFVGLYTINPQRTGLHVKIFDTNGRPKSWSFSSNAWITAACWGTAAI